METKLVKILKGRKTLEAKRHIKYPQITLSSLGYTLAFKKSLQAFQRCSNNLHITDNNRSQRYLL